MELQQHALDIFENIGRLLVLRGISDFYLACLKKMIFDSDRARILGALRSFNQLILNESNHKIMLEIDTPVIQRLLQLLLVADEEIVLVVMVFFYLSKDFFYLFTNLSPDAGLRITGSVRFNVFFFNVGFKTIIKIFALETIWKRCVQCDYNTKSF
jgi:hypothetical protein